MTTTITLNYIATTCSAMIANSLKAMKAIDDDAAASEEADLLFTAYVEANKAGDYALATILKNKWLVATAGL